MVSFKGISMVGGSLFLHAFVLTVTVQPVFTYYSSFHWIVSNFTSGFTTTRLSPVNPKPLVQLAMFFTTLLHSTKKHWMNG